MRTPARTLEIMAGMIEWARRQSLQPHVFNIGFFTKRNIIAQCRAGGMRAKSESEPAKVFGVPCAINSFDDAIAVCCYPENDTNGQHCLLVYTEDMDL